MGKYGLDDDSGCLSRSCIGNVYGQRFVKQNQKYPACLSETRPEF